MNENPFYSTVTGLIETVRIVDDDCVGGHRTINKSDLMPDDVLYVDPADEVQK